MTMHVEEVYFLVRVGTWGPEELEAWCQARMVANDDDTYELGHTEGYREGYREGVVCAKADEQRWGYR